MIFHIVRFALADELTDAERETCLDLLAGLDRMESTISATVCQDLSDATSGFTHSVIVVLAGESQYTEYQVDPFHVEVVGYVIPRFKRMMICDAADDVDPGLYERLQHAQAISPAVTPEIVAHMQAIQGAS